MIPIYRPFLPARSVEYAKKALESGWISSHGEYVERATEAFKKRFGYRHALLTNTGTSAGHLVAIALRRCRNRVRYLTVPNNVYVAAWNVLRQEFPGRHLWAVEPDETTWQANYSDVEGFRPEQIAVLIVHNVGGVLNVPALMGRYPGVTFIEDNCEGLFGQYNGLPTGSMTFASSVSFFGNKTITTGEGGAFVTADDEAFAIATKAHSQGMSDRRYVHDVVGYNYKMTNIQAALLLGQLEVVDEILRKKARVFSWYRSELPAEITGRVLLPSDEPGTRNANWMMAVRIAGSPGYDAAEAFMKEHGVEIRPMFYAINRHRHLRSVRCQGTRVADLLNRECFMLPSYPELTEAEVAHVIMAVHAFAAKVESVTPGATPGSREVA